MIGQRILEDSRGTVRPSRLTVPVRAGFPRIAAAIVAAVVFSLSMPARAQDTADLAQQLQRVRRELSDLQAYIYSGKAPSREAVAGIAAESGQSTARMQVQLQNLEGQMRDLTGRVEEVEHGVARVTERLEKLNADLEIRFQALESGKRPAGGIAPGGTSPAPERRASAGGGSETTASATPSKTPAAAGLQPGQEVFGTMSQSGGASAVKPPIKNLPEGVDGLPPKTGAKEGDQLASAGSPRDRYETAFQHLQKRDYDKAATEFDAFVKANPENPLSSNALYWLGETHYYRKNYAEAARVFLDGYKRYPKGNKAPDDLFKLGKSLAAINEKQPACAAWNKLLKSFPSANKRLLGNAKSELSKLGCS
jgi:tol-pal system protein YbgF